MVARVEPAVAPVKPVALATPMAPASPKDEAPRRVAARPSTEAAKPKLTSRKPPVLRKAAAKPVERTEKSLAAPAAIPASLAKAKPLVAAGDNADWETF